MPFPNPNGRPTKLTPDMQERICQYLRVSATRRSAAAAVGLPEETICRWAAKNPEFRQALETAEEDAKLSLLACLHQQARRGSATAASWLLERRGGPEFRPPKQELEVSIDVGSLPDEQLTRIAAAEPAALAEVARAS